MRLGVALSVLSGIAVCTTNSTTETSLMLIRKAKGPNIADLGRGKKGKKNKRRQKPEARWNALIQTMDGFLKKNLGGRHKKIRNHLNRVKEMTNTNLPLPGARSPNCLKHEESAAFIRKSKAEKRKSAIAQRRSQRMETQDRRKEARIAKQLFKDDIIEENDTKRRRRDDYNDEEYYDYDIYPELILTEEEMKEYESDFLTMYPDYASLEEDDDMFPDELPSVMARARRKKKKGGGKIGPKRVWFNLLTAARGFINTELKGCAERKKFIERVGRLAERVKKNAPILTAPVKKCRGRKCRKQKGK